MQVGERMKLRRKELKISADTLAEVLGVSRSTIFRYEKGDIEKLPTDSLGIIAKVLKTTPEELMGWKVPDTDKKSIDSIYNQLDESRQQNVYNFAEKQLMEQNRDNTIDISDYLVEESHDIYLQSKVSAGRGSLDLDPEHADQVPYKGKLPRYYDLAFEIDGDSMKPMFEDSEIIFVEKMDYPINGAIMVVQIDEEAFIKKIYIEENRLRLVSLNPDYDDIYADAHNEIRIVGKVVS